MWPWTRNSGCIQHPSENINDGPFHPSSHKKRGNLLSDLTIKFAEKTPQHDVSPTRELHLNVWIRRDSTCMVSHNMSISTIEVGPNIKQSARRGTVFVLEAHEVFDKKALQNWYPRALTVIDILYRQFYVWIDCLALLHNRFTSTLYIVVPDELFIERRAYFSYFEYQTS
jgi:hypothetical protein